MEYTFKTKQMIKASEIVGDFYEIQEAQFNSDIKALAELISIFGDIKKEEAFDYIDEQIDKKRTIKDLYDEIFKGINEKGFFNQQLRTDLETLPVNMNKLTNEMFKKYMDKEVEKQIIKASKNM